MSLGTGTVVAQYEKEPSTLKILKCATDANPLFEGLDDQQRAIVYGAFVEETYEADEIIIREGDPQRQPVFFRHLVEDHASLPGGQYSYQEFMAHVSRHA